MVRARASPAQKHPDVARHAAGEIHDLGAQLVALRLEFLLPELMGTFAKPVRLLGQSGSKLLIAPPRSGQYSLEKAQHHHLPFTPLGSTFHRPGDPLEHFRMDPAT
jgi:hypothetical protein